MQSFVLTGVRDCDLLIVITSSTFLINKKRHVKRIKQLAQIIKNQQPSIHIDNCTLYTYTVYMYTAL